MHSTPEHANRPFERATAGGESASGDALSRRGRVLIADDSADNTEILRQSIESDQYEVRAARDGRAALDLLESWIPDVVLLDVMMPRMDGITVLKALRSSETLRDTKVIMVSARVQVDDVVGALTMGADDYVTKPFHPDVVRARVRVHFRSKVAHDELKRVSKLKDEFLSIASHDLQNPVANIITFCRMMEEYNEEDLGTQPRHALTRVKKNAEFMLELIGDLLDVMQLEAGRMRLYCDRTDVASALREAMDRNRFAASDKEISLGLDLEPRLPDLRADAMKLQRLLNNLISNAIKYSQPGASVTVRARRADGGIQFDVADTGQGIPAAELPKLFKMFGRSSVRTTRGERSTGLGLMIARKIVDLHGGRIWVTSEVGRGSTFSVVLPLEPVAPSHGE